MAETIVVFVTASSEDEARDLARALLQQKLAACVNLVPVRSLYVWENDLHDDPEVLLIIKSRADVFEALAAAVRAKHSYDTPEIIAAPVVFGSDDYIKWIHDVVTG